MATLQQAAALAARGLKVFRLEAGAKDRFVDTNWATGGATNDPFELADRFSSGGYNIGVLATSCLILDVDAHKEGFASLAALEAAAGPFPETLKVRTPRGGLHIYFKAPEGVAFANSVQKLGPGLDVRATNGYVVGPGSTWDGHGAYSIEHMPPPGELPEVPAALASRVQAARARQLDAQRVTGEVDEAGNVAAAVAYLRSSAPVAIEGSGGNATTYAVACKLLDLGCSPEKALELLDEVYNERCSPPWEPEELERIVSNAAQYRQEPIGSKNPEHGFGAIPPELQEKLAAQAAAILLWDLDKLTDEELLEFPDDIRDEEFAEQQANALVADLIGPGELSVIYGDSAAGKSFLAVDMCYHIALGRRWNGRRINQAPVLYVSLEGVQGFRRRMSAARGAIGNPGKWFSRLKPDVALDASEEGHKGMGAVVRAYQHLMRETGSPRGGVIVIDTLARAIAGDDENETKTMTAFVKRCGMLAKATGAAVLLVHHTNKQGVIRGSGALFAAADCVIRVERNKVDKDLRRATGEKVKDGRDGFELVRFDLHQVVLHRGAMGCEPVTSCLISQATRHWPDPEDEKKASAGFKALK